MRSTEPDQAPAALHDLWNGLRQVTAVLGDPDKIGLHSSRVWKHRR